MATAAAQQPTASVSGNSAVFSYRENTAIRRVTRKPNRQAAQNKGFDSVHEHYPITDALRDEIEAQLDELAAAHDPREYSAVIAKRLGLGRNGEHLVDEVAAGLIARYRAGYKSCRVGAKAMLDMAAEAAADAWGDVA